MHIERAIKRLTERHAPAKVTSVVSEAIEKKKIDPRSVRLAVLANEFLGGTGYEAEMKLRAHARGQTNLLEAGEAVDVSNFVQITGQLLVTEVKERYKSPEFIGDMLVRKIPNPGANLGEHKVPYLNDVAVSPSVLGPGELYPHSGFTGSYVTLAAPAKRGLIVDVTMEFMLADYTGQAQEAAASVGRRIGLDREQRILSVALGLTNNYKWSINATGDAQSLNTYVSTANAGLYVNRLASTTITNYDHINSIEQMFAQMTDPVTGLPILVTPKLVLCAPEKRMQLERILNASQVRSGDITSGDGIQTVSDNPLKNSYTIHTSQIARQLLKAASLSDSVVKERVYFFEPNRPIYYREVYPFKTEQAPPNNPLEWNQDIVTAIKCGEFGVAGVYDPRYAGLSTSEA